MHHWFSVGTDAVILQGWSFCGQIFWICDVPHLQAVRSLISFGRASVLCQWSRIVTFAVSGVLTPPSIYTFLTVGWLMYFLIPLRIPHLPHDLILRGFSLNLPPSHSPFTRKFPPSPDRSVCPPSRKTHPCWICISYPVTKLTFFSRFFVDPESAHPLILFHTIWSSSVVTPLAIIRLYHTPHNNPVVCFSPVSIPSLDSVDYTGLAPDLPSPRWRWRLRCVIFCESGERK